MGNPETKSSQIGVNLGLICVGLGVFEVKKFENQWYKETQHKRPHCRHLLDLCYHRRGMLCCWSKNSISGLFLVLIRETLTVELIDGLSGTSGPPCLNTISDWLYLGQDSMDYPLHSVGYSYLILKVVIM